MDTPHYLTIENLTEEEIKRIFSKVFIEPNTECWIWNGTRNGTNYGLVWFRGRFESAHRFMWALFREPLQKGVGKDIPQIDHFYCDNPPCCNPDHLKLVSLRENTLRDNLGVSSVNARKTVCIKGHALEKTSGGVRRCPICRREYMAQYTKQYKRTDERREYERIWQQRKREKVKQSKGQA